MDAELVQRFPKAAKDSIRLQEAAMGQWVDVEVAKVKDVVIEERERNESIIVTTLHLKAINNTEYPLTIKKVFTEISTEDSNDWLPFTVKEDLILPPSGEKNSFRTYPFFVSIHLVQTAAEKYLDGKSILRVNGEVTFVDVLRNSLPQKFSFAVSHSQNNWRVLEFIGKHPT